MKSPHTLRYRRPGRPSTDPKPLVPRGVVGAGNLRGQMVGRCADATSLPHHRRILTIARITERIAFTAPTY